MDSTIERSATTKKDGKKAKRSFGGLTSAVLVVAFGYFLANGNPTQQVGKLLKMCRDGMAGGEGVDKFDEVSSYQIKGL